MLDKSKLQQAYSSGKSMAEIALELHCSIHTIVYWMNKYNLKRRSRSDASYIKLNPNGDPFTIKNQLNHQESFLLGLGTGIYWGEGEKVSKHSIRVANTDVDLIKTFRKFLLEICGLNYEKISYSLIIFNDTDALTAQKYWSKQLKISEQKFGKIVIIPKQGKGTYKRKSEFGVCTITANNIKLKSWLLSQIEKIKADIV